MAVNTSGKKGEGGIGGIAGERTISVTRFPFFFEFDALMLIVLHFHKPLLSFKAAGDG